jgi:predicted RNA methylase
VNHANIHMLSISATSDAERAGAIKKDTWVRAKMGSEWKVARIVEAQIVEGEVGSSST